MKQKKFKLRIKADVHTVVYKKLKENVFLVLSGRKYKIKLQKQLGFFG